MRRKDEVTREIVLLAILYAALGSAALIGLINWMDYSRDVGVSKKIEQEPRNHEGSLLFFP